MVLSTYLVMPWSCQLLPLSWIWLGLNFLIRIVCDSLLWFFCWWLLFDLLSRHALIQLWSWSTGCWFCPPGLTQTVPENQMFPPFEPYVRDAWWVGVPRTQALLGFCHCCCWRSFCTFQSSSSVCSSWEEYTVQLPPFVLLFRSLLALFEAPIISSSSLLLYSEHVASLPDGTSPYLEFLCCSFTWFIPLLS